MSANYRYLSCLRASQFTFVLSFVYPVRILWKSQPKVRLRVIVTLFVKLYNVK